MVCALSSQALAHRLRGADRLFWRIFGRFGGLCRRGARMQIDGSVLRQREAAKTEQSQGRQRDPPRNRHQGLLFARGP
jgi:hypothetical protein